MFVEAKAEKNDYARAMTMWSTEILKVLQKTPKNINYKDKTG